MPFSTVCRTPRITLPGKPGWLIPVLYAVQDRQRDQAKPADFTSGHRGYDAPGPSQRQSGSHGSKSTTTLLPFNLRKKTGNTFHLFSWQSLIAWRMCFIAIWIQVRKCICLKGLWYTGLKQVHFLLLCTLLHCFQGSAQLLHCLHCPTYFKTRNFKILKYIFITEGIFIYHW